MSTDLCILKWEKRCEEKWTRKPAEKGIGGFVVGLIKMDTKYIFADYFLNKHGTHLFMQIKNIYEKGYQLSYALAKIKLLNICLISIFRS